MQTDLPTLTLTAFVNECEKRKPGFLQRCRTFAQTNPSFLLKSFQTSCGKNWKGVEDLTSPELIDSWRSTEDLRHYDFVCYVFWRVAAEDVGKSTDRLALLSDVGRVIYEKTVDNNNNNNPDRPLTRITPTLKSLLEKFKEANLVESYRVVSGEAIEAVESFKPFDYLDDEDIVKGNDVNLVLSIRKVRI
ncbi:hypothetical protein TL16_g08645 [Triparma laevis f. inornata]|uniref:Uncharacterized protein n=1 Tax=Triparma laevis f. inornata TaxID=1714386 RepID=A0A9W7EIY1_9STRA|nr:hypothetical protein TL16_g08645 [Triparma laevis f. inornata]